LKESAELDALNQALEARRAELGRLEERIRRQKAQSAIEEKWLAELKASRAKVTKERDDRREAGIRKLARLYEGMQPEAAAMILGNLDKSMATEILASMKDRQASRVLEAMNGQRARELSERLQDARLARTPGEGMEKQEAQ
jgi:flagellar motility protein MotE (MotC chaperone)